jgi:hypothetical protein
MSEGYEAWEAVVVYLYFEAVQLSGWEGHVALEPWECVVLDSSSPWNEPNASQPMLGIDAENVRTMLSKLEEEESSWIFRGNCEIFEHRSLSRI